MSKYINASTAAEIISEKHNIPLSDLVDTFATIPTVDAKPVVRGEWVKLETADEYVCKCSICNYPISGWHKTNFCPDCGAEMRGDK